MTKVVISRAWRLLVLLLAAAELAVPTTAVAQTRSGSDPLSITLALKRVQLDSAGKEVLVDAPKVAPGDLVEYTAVYTNKGDQPLSNVVATLPLPEGTEYLRNSAHPSSALASAGGGSFRPEPLTRTVVGKDGKQTTQPVPYGQYRALRWRLADIRPGASVEVKARARISQTPTSTAVHAQQAESK